MSSVSSLLARLKHESKKSVSKAAKDSGVTYRTDSIELFGENLLIKRVSIENNVGYNVGWVMDNQTKSCMRCNYQFNMMMWRHHCRSCGFVICNPCGDKKLNFTAFEEESPAGSRVCRPCFNAPTTKAERKGPPTLVSRTPVQADISTHTVEEAAQAQPEPSAQINEVKKEKELTTSAPAVAAETQKIYAPKLRPSVPCGEITAPAPVQPKQPGHAVLVDTTRSAPSAPISAQPSTSSAPAGKKSQASAPAPAPSAPVTTTCNSATENAESRDRHMPLPIFDEPDHCGSSLDSSIISTGTKTARNTAINATLVAPPPKRGQTCTAPEIFSPAPLMMRKLDYLDLETPPSGGSIGLGEVAIDVTKFGSPTTRKLIMEDARSNVIWECADDDISSTNGSSVAPTPTSAISGTTNGGAGVGYIRSPYNATFSPFGSQQKPRRLLPGTGQSSVGRSGRLRSSSAGRVRFADASFSADAGMDIIGAAPVENSPSLPLTREQLQQQQERYRAEAAAQGKPTTRPGLRGAAQNDAENRAAVANQLPSTAAQATDKTAKNPTNKTVTSVPTAAVSGANKGNEQAAAPVAAQQFSVPALNKPNAGRMAPR